MHLRTAERDGVHQNEEPRAPEPGRPVWEHPPVDDPTGAHTDDAPVALDLEGYLTDPQAELRRCAALSWCAHAVDEHGEPLPIVLGHADVREVMRDRRLSPRSFTADMIAAGLAERTALQLTPLFRRHGEEHRAFRGLLSAAFTPRRVERIRPAAAAVAARLADDIAASGGACEFVEAFAAPMPPEVFAALFGLPPADRDRLARWGSTVVAAFTPPLGDEQIVAVAAAAVEMREWSLGLVADRRARPTDDLVTHLVEAEVDGERLGDEDVVDVICGFVFAGSETTRRQLTATVVAFAEHPDDWERLAADPALVPGAVEEVMRLRPIVPGMRREAVEAFAHRGVELAPAERIVTSFVTANTDPGVFADPDTFDVTRPNAADHVTFGWGPHFCIGAGLARVELQEAVTALVTRFGPPVLGDVVADQPAGRLLAPDALPVRFPARAG